MFHFLRSNPEVIVNLKALIAAYFSILIVIPALSALNLAALNVLIPNNLQTSLIPYTEPITNLYLSFAFSPLFSWAGALMSVPLVWVALRQRWFGWGIATLTGIALFQVNWVLFIRQELVRGASTPVSSEWMFGTFGSAVLGLTFWIAAISFSTPKR